MHVGVDIGSCSAKMVVLEGERMLFSGESFVTEGGAVAVEDLTRRAAAQTGIGMDGVLRLCTGVGWKGCSPGSEHRSEQSCHARGVYSLLPSARTVLDAGADGARVMKINDKGRVVDFASTSKCAAGTGTFLEAVAKIMEIPITEFGAVGLTAKKSTNISSFCAVFAESEVISSIHKGITRETIIAGIHESVVDRLIELLNRVGIERDVALTGGIARNSDILSRLQRRAGTQILTPEHPEFSGALGAALIARDLAS